MLHTISNGKFTLKAESMGAEMKSLKGPDGKEYIWNGDPAFWTGSSPNLFPIVCSLKDNKAVIDGVTYHISKHGFAKKMEFAVASQQEDEITFLLTSDDSTRACYPFEFAFSVTHRVTDDGFETEYRVKNNGNRLMYYAVGGHPAFCCPMNPGEDFADYDIIFETLETNPVYQSTPNDIGGLLHREGINQAFMNISSFPLSYDVFKLDALVFETINSSWIKLINRNTGYGILFRYENFHSLGIWTKVGAPYICLEPWTAIPDRDDATGVLAEKPHIRTLQAGQEQTYRYGAAII